MLPTRMKTRKLWNCKKNDDRASTSRIMKITMPMKRKNIVPKLFAIDDRELSKLNPACKPSIAANPTSARKLSKT